MRAMASDYMYWAKTQAPVRYGLSSSEVPHVRLDRFVPTIDDLELDGASRYRYPPLRAAIARKCGVSPDHVVMADGTSMATMLAMATLITPGDHVLIEHPVYEPMTAAALHCGADVRHFSRTEPDFRINLDSVEDGLLPETKLIVLTNLHNPTGNHTDPATLRALGDMAAKVGARVLIDEIFLDAAIPGQPSAALFGDTFLTVSSLTKCYGLSGLRCGWILAAPPLAERIWRLNELYGVAQAHAAERLSLLALDRLDEIAEDMSALLERNRVLANAFFAGRDDLDCVPMRGGITAFPRLLTGDVEALNHLLRDRYDTSIVPGRFFGAPDRFRIGIGQPTEIVEGGLERLGAALDSLR